MEERLKISKKLRPITKDVTTKGTLKILKILFPDVDSFVDSVESFSKYTDKILYEVRNDKSKRAGK